MGVLNIKIDGIKKEFLNLAAAKDNRTLSGYLIHAGLHYAECQLDLDWVLYAAEHPDENDSGVFKVLQGFSDKKRGPE